MRAQPHFEGSERTDGTQPGLRNDDRDSPKVREPEAEGVDPPPITKVANDDESKASNDERDNSEVQRKYRIRK